MGAVTFKKRLNNNLLNLFHQECFADLYTLARIVKKADYHWKEIPDFINWKWDIFFVSDSFSVMDFCKLWKTLFICQISMAISFVLSLKFITWIQIGAHFGLRIGIAPIQSFFFISSFANSLLEHPFLKSRIISNTKMCQLISSNTVVIHLQKKNLVKLLQSYKTKFVYRLESVCCVECIWNFV